MKTITINLFDIDELNPVAQKKALGWMYENCQFPCSYHYNNSLKHFCDALGISVAWVYDLWNTFNFSRNHEDWNNTLKVESINKFDRHYMPTGFYTDCFLWETFYDYLKKSDPPTVAIEKALTCFFKEWENDINWYYSNESMIDIAKENNYNFLEDGTFFKSLTES